jgi:hypothetical protein
MKEFPRELKEVTTNDKNMEREIYMEDGLIKPFTQHM